MTGALAARPVPPLPAGAPGRGRRQPLAISLASLFEAAWRVSPALRRAGAERMLRSAFEELFNHLDPYSRYLTPQEAVAARGRRIGQTGLGLRLAAGPRQEVVLAAVTPDCPASRAGLRLNDQVLAVDGQPRFRTATWPAPPRCWKAPPGPRWRCG